MKARSALVLLITAFFLLSWFPAGVFADELKVEKGVICLDVKDRMPVSEADKFPSSTTKVFCYTVIQGAQTPAQITHVWQYKGKKMFEITLPVKFIKWRTWSAKNIRPSQIGPWAVDIVDTASNKVIDTIHFSIK